MPNKPKYCEMLQQISKKKKQKQLLPCLTLLNITYCQLLLIY